MTIRLSVAHRDALYEHILNRLSGINDLWKAVEARDYERATRFGWEYSDFLRLILDDLDWGDGPGRSVELSAPPDVLGRVFSVLRDLAVGLQASEAADLAQLREHEERNNLVIEACDSVLADLRDEQQS